MRRSRRNRGPWAEGGPARVLIVDDSLTVRTVFKRMIESSGKLEIAGTANTAERALSMLRKPEEIGRVDVILLDLEMPGMGGLEALPLLLDTDNSLEVLVVSSLTEDGAEATIKALSMGAADTMLKPRPGGFNDEYQAQLLSKIAALGENGSELQKTSSASQADVSDRSCAQVPASFQPEVIAFGASTGGIHALNVILKAMPDNFDVPILITQHLPSSFIPVFARQIEVVSNRPAVIAEDGVPIRAGEIAIATGHGHMVVKREHGALVCRLGVAPAPSGCMPSVDPMLSSLAEACDGNVLAIILSGMGRDGALGAAELARRGGVIFAQDAKSSAVWGMPGAVAKAGITSFIAPPEDLAQAAFANAQIANDR